MWTRRAVRWANSTAVATSCVLLNLASPASPASGATGAVGVQANNFRFCSAGSVACTPTDSGTVTTVPTGTTVTWTYPDTACDAVVPCPGHNVTFKDAAGKTIKADGQVLLTRTFTAPGSYPYQCTIHVGFGMTGTVVVEGAATSGTNGGSSTSPSTTRTLRSAGGRSAATSGSRGTLANTGRSPMIGLGGEATLAGFVVVHAWRRRRLGRSGAA